MYIGSLKLDIKNKAYVMGILNVTPDSFSDGGSYNTVTLALKHCEHMLEDGADIIDIGAESTRPGHTQVSTDEEIRRLLPVIKALRKEFRDVPLSVDCYRVATARAALEAGADMINDIWGLTYEANMATLIAEYEASVCIMHNRSNRNYVNLIEDVKQDLTHQLSLASQAGIARSRICLDPGIGFAKGFKENLVVLRHLEEFTSFDLPLLLGTSRKGFLGRILDVPAAERDAATAVTSALGYEKGCRLFRVHDIKATKEALLVTQAIAEAEYGSD